MIFQQMKPGTSVIPHFHVISTGQSIFCIIFMIQGHLQGQKVNFKVKETKIPFLPIKARNMCDTSFYGILSEKSNNDIILVTQVFFQGRKVISIVENKMAARYFKVK